MKEVCQLAFIFLQYVVKKILPEENIMQVYTDIQCVGHKRNLTKLLNGQDISNCSFCIKACKNKNFVIFSLSTAQKMKFSMKDFFSKCDQICRKLRIWSYLLKKSLMKNFISCAVFFILQLKIINKITSVKMYVVSFSFHRLNLQSVARCNSQVTKLDQLFFSNFIFVYN